MAGNSVLVSRRALIGGLASTGGLMLAGCSGEQPTYGSLLRMGDNFTYGAQRLLLPAKALAREYDRSAISSMPAIGTVDPSRADSEFYSPEGGAAYAALKHGGFADWRLRVDGSVARPAAFALADLQRMASRTQITKHMCEEGWSSIAEWTGVPLRTVLEAAGIRPSARYVQFHTFDGIIDSIDMVDALHPQTLLAYGMNGRALPISHGAPVRLRVERQLGYKSMKFLHRIEVTDDFVDPGRAGPIAGGWAWYVGV